MSILDQSASAGSAVLDPIAAKIQNPFNTGPISRAERPQDFPGGFVIIEYINGAAQPNPIKLVGNLMPFQPFGWDAEQRLVVEYYPGNPEPAVHVMGAKEGDLKINGRFKDKRYKDASYYGVSYQFAQLLDQLRERGNLLKFGMYGQGGNWVRYGFLQKFDFKMNKLSWIDYELTFTGVTKNQPINNFFAAPEKNPPSSVNQNLIDKATAFQASLPTPPSVPQSISDLMNGIINGVAKNINLVTNFVSTIISTVTDIEASANRALGLIQNARTSIAVYRRQIDALVHNYANYSTQVSPKGQFRDVFTNLAYIQGIRTQMNGLSSQMAQLQAQFEKIAQTIPIARYLVKAGDTLQNISIKFYGSSDNWKLIFDHNHLQSTSLTAGVILEIPRA